MAQIILLEILNGQGKTGVLRTWIEQTIGICYIYIAQLQVEVVKSIQVRVLRSQPLLMRIIKRMESSFEHIVRKGYDACSRCYISLYLNKALTFFQGGHAHYQRRKK